MAWPIFGMPGISGWPLLRGVLITMPSTRKIAPLPFIRKWSIACRALSSSAWRGPPTTSASTSSGMSADDGFTVVVSNSCDSTCLSAWKPSDRSCSPWPLVKAILRFFCVMRLISDDTWYSSPSGWPISGIASSWPWYLKHRPR